MAIISYDPEEEIEYTPSFAGNRGDKKPCIVTLKFLGHEGVNGLLMDMAKDTDTKTVSGFQSNSNANEKKKFLSCIVSIKGYFIKGKEITKPKEFYRTADHELIKELLNAIVSSVQLTEGQVKN